MRHLLTLLIGLSFSGLTWAESTLGLPALVIPADNPQTTEKITLGRLLFNDKRLSADGSISCASCHQAGKAFTDGLTVAKGVAGQTGTRNTPSVLNAAFYQTQFLDGREQSLEAQALGPMVNPVEHGLKDHQAILEIIRQDPNYLSLMTRVFNIQPQELTTDHIGKAIASFERTLIAGDSPFDRYYFGMDQSAISESAARGSRIFRRKGNCAVCHEISINNALFTDNRFYNIGVGYKQLQPVLDEWLAATARGDQPDYSAWSDVQRSELGRYAVTKMPANIGQFKTPTLHNVALTAPYMHDGSIKTLEEVIEHYDKGGESSRFVDAKVFPLHLTKQEKADLLAFLQSLTSFQYTQPTAGPAHE
ncbi:MAG: cytochrome c peroxidase [Methylococcaceae bacterium]|nr:cytochrome c peroxidase [Methylococcaceae bacterium]